MTAPAPAGTPPTATPTATPTGTATDPTAPVPPDFAALLAGLVPTAGPTPPMPPTPPTPAGPGAPKDGEKSSEKTEKTETPTEESPGDVALAAVLVVPVPPAPVAAPDAPAPTGTTGQTGQTTGPTDAEPAPVTPATTAVPALPTVPTTPTAPILPSVAAPAPVPVASPAPAATPASVSRQLFDRVEKLATSTVSGSHRMTVRLDPGTLGEVRVHLSVRAGQVTVRLSAGSEARAALTEGAPQLQRLLEGAKGAGAHVTVAVHDLPAAHPTHLAATHLTVTGAAGGDLLRPADAGPGSSAGNPAGNQAGAQPGDQPGDQPASQHQPDLLDARAGGEWTGAGTGQPGDPGAHAGTRRATTARDGDQDRVTGPASAEPSTTGPRRGVDVRM